MTRRGVILIAVAAVVIALDGWLLAVTWHLPFGTGLYCSAGTASTVGCSPSLSGAAQVAATVAILTSVPLLAAVFAMLTGLHLRRHVAESETRIKAHLEERLRHHLGPAKGAPK